MIHDYYCMLQDVAGPPECSFWDQTLDQNYGAWSSEGCSLVRDGGEVTSCHCSHLTNFAILVDTSDSQQDKHIGAAIIIGPVILLFCATFVIISIIITR